MVLKEAKGLFIASPDVFQLSYKTGGEDHKFLNRFKPMALLNMAVNYTVPELMRHMMIQHQFT